MRNEIISDRSRNKQQQDGNNSRSKSGSKTESPSSDQEPISPIAAMLRARLEAFEKRLERGEAFQAESSTNIIPRKGESIAWSIYHLPISR